LIRDAQYHGLKLKEDLIRDINYLKLIYNKCNKIFVIAALTVAVLTI